MYLPYYKSSFFFVTFLCNRRHLPMRSYTIKLITIFILISTSTIAFSNFTDDEEYIKLIKLEQKALLNGIGKTYIYDLTGRKDCNKTRIKYLGIARTKRGKQYKILTSFFVFSTASSCRGTSKVKIFDMQNRYIGEYYMGMPDALPVAFSNNRLIFLKANDSCTPRKKIIINFSNGIPKALTFPSSRPGGEISYFYFSSVSS